MLNTRISIVVAALAFVSARSATPLSPDAAATGATSSDSRFDRPYPYNANLP